MSYYLLGYFFKINRHLFKLKDNYTPTAYQKIWNTLHSNSPPTLIEKEIISHFQNGDMDNTLYAILDEHNELFRPNNTGLCPAKEYSHYFSPYVTWISSQAPGRFLLYVAGSAHSTFELSLSSGLWNQYAYYVKKMDF